MKFDNLLRYAVRILNAYQGETPLAGWLKNFFRENPQMGSRDRKQVSEMVYSYFRLGHALKNIPQEERILSGLFLSHPQQEPILDYFRPAWNQVRSAPLEDKLKVVKTKFQEFDELQIFPWAALLSEGINHRNFCLSFLSRPKLFLRVRPGKGMTVQEKLNENGLSFQIIDADSGLPFPCYALESGVRLDDVLALNQDAVIQDLNSQRTAGVLKPDSKKEFEAWDCCSGSGGKAILLQDLFPECKLTVSDIRDSILKNLSVRFREAGVQPNQMFQADLTDANDLPRQSYNYILADLPCSGSGTWGRTPEALYFFEPGFIDPYRQRQEKILSNVISRLKPNGDLIYITCSVFADENERISSVVSGTGQLKKVMERLYTGYQEDADTMYAVRFVKL